MTLATLYTGDPRTILPTLPERSVRCCVTSPPYFGLRDYGTGDAQIGLESSPTAYVDNLVAVFREVRRVLTDDGTLWLNLGDSYAGSANSGGANMNAGGHAVRLNGLPTKTGDGIKTKDLLGIPWRVAFALQADGWWLRSDIIWHKPNPMPESVTDRPTKAHEYVFLLTKSARYYYDAAAIAEQSVSTEDPRFGGPRKEYASKYAGAINLPGRQKAFVTIEETRNARTVWTVPTKPYGGAHFAVMPEELARRCVLAGSAPGDTVLDPFSGSGTTAAMATGNGRRAIGCDLNPAYHALAVQRIGPMLTTMQEATAPAP